MISLSWLVDKLSINGLFVIEIGHTVEHSSLKALNQAIGKFIIMLLSDLANCAGQLPAGS